LRHSIRLLSPTHHHPQARKCRRGCWATSTAVCASLLSLSLSHIVCCCCCHNGVLHWNDKVGHGVATAAVDHGGTRVVTATTHHSVLCTTSSHNHILIVATAAAVLAHSTGRSNNNGALVCHYADAADGQTTRSLWMAQKSRDCRGGGIWYSFIIDFDWYNDNCCFGGDNYNYYCNNNERLVVDGRAIGRRQWTRRDVGRAKFGRRHCCQSEWNGKDSIGAVVGSARCGSVRSKYYEAKLLVFVGCLDCMSLCADHKISHHGPCWVLLLFCL
jgi:hypothetical protein